MARQRRLLLASLVTAWAGMFLACGGAPNRGGLPQPQPDAAAPQPGVAANQAKPNEPGNVPANEPGKAPVNAANEPDAKERAEAKAKRRAKAEADAKAQDEVNLRNYEADVAALTKQHKEKLEEYKEAKDAFDQASKAYQVAKGEREGALKLDEARTLLEGSMKPGASKLLKSFAQKRLQEIISLYPDTQAAKDAKGLLNDEYVAVRKIPTLPAVPKKPMEPRPLVSPSPPAPVAVVYPLEPEEIAAQKAAAEAARQAEAERQAKAEAARRAEEEYDVNGLVLLMKSLKGVTKDFGGEITGTVVNRRNRKLRYAQVKFNVYNEGGAQVGSALANVNDLEPGGRWDFKAVTLNNNWRTYKVIELTGF